MSDLSPLTAEARALATLDAARDRCPHWDYDGGPDGGFDCCLDVDAAARAFRKARRFRKLDATAREATR